MPKDRDVPHVRRVNPEESGSNSPSSSSGKKGKAKSKATDDLGDKDKKANSDSKATDDLGGENQGVRRVKANDDADDKKFKNKAKNAAGMGQAAGKAGVLAQLLQAGKAMMMLLVNMMSTAATAITGGAGFLATIWNAITTFVSNLVSSAAALMSSAIAAVGNFLSVGATAATAIVTTGVTAAIVVPVMIGASLFTGNDPALYDSMLEDCATTVESEMSAIENGDLDAIQLDHAKQVYSIYKTYGLGDNQIAGMLGNWSVESGIDPTGVEGIFDEKYQIGPKKKEALENPDPHTRKLFANYAANGKSVNHAQYMGSDGQYWPGLGMPQITSGYRIVEPAEKMGKNWYDMDFQMAFMLAMGTETTTGRGGGREFFNTYKDETDGMSAGECAAYFLDVYEGVPNDSSIGTRAQAAESWSSQMSSWTVDKAYADSVFEMAEQLGAIASDGAVSDKKDRCVKVGKYNNSDIANAAASYSWPTKEQGIGNDGTELFQRVYVNIWGMRYFNGQPMQSCDVCVSTAVRWSGSDITYPAYSTPIQLEYLLSSPKWEKVGMMGSLTKEDLQPGDVGVLDGHTWLYTGPEAIQRVHGKDNPGDCVSASYNERSPGAGNDADWYFQNNGIDSYHGREYYIFRLTKPDKSDKYKSAGESVPSE